MPDHVIIDGNNLLYAMPAHAPLPSIGRETLVRIIDRWARQGDDAVTLVFDGPVPDGSLSKQMSSDRIAVLFSAPVTADDVIVRLIHDAKHPTDLRVISSDNAILHEARGRKCRNGDCPSFIQELFTPQGEPHPPTSTPGEKPPGVTRQEAKQWLDEFGFGDDGNEPFNGYEAMNQ